MTRDEARAREAVERLRRASSRLHCIKINEGVALSIVADIIATAREEAIAAFDEMEQRCGAGLYRTEREHFIDALRSR